MRATVFSRSLSAKILLLTVTFVIVGELLLYIPSIARFRLGYLQERIAAAHLATLNLSPRLALELDMDTLDALLRHAGVLSITVGTPGSGLSLMLGEVAPPDRIVDLSDQRWPTLIKDAFETFRHRGERLIRVVGESPQEKGTIVDVILPEAPLWVAMVDQSIRILSLSVALSLVVASLLFLSLQTLIVEPLRRITRELAVFRDRPEDATADIAPPRRTDEIGVVERALADMRQALRQALATRTRLAALGAAMSRISHDLKNILSTAVLISDRLESSADPSVRKVAPRLIDTLDRAARLCSETLSYARTGPPAPVVQQTNLVELIGKVQAALDGGAASVRWHIEVPEDLDLLVDPDQFFRVLFNLARNAIEAMGAGGGELTISAEPGPHLLILDVADTGPGIPARVKEQLFEPFASSAKPDGTGLGLAICRELMRAHGGEIELLESSERGSVFRLRLPARSTMRAGGGGGGARRTAMPVTTVARSALLLSLLLAGCGYQGPGIAGYPGLQFKTQSFYDARATEENWTCTRPRMRSVTAAQVIDETPTHVVMNVRYYWYDEGQTITDDNVPFAAPFLQRCNGFAERTFTYAKMTDGSLEPESMTGPQRRR